MKAKIGSGRSLWVAVLGIILLGAPLAAVMAEGSARSAAAENAALQEAKPVQPQEGEPPVDAEAYDPGSAIEAEIQDLSDLYFYNVSGSTFRPRTNLIDYQTTAGGCTYIVSGSASLNFAVHLPDSARIENIRLYYYDSAPTDSFAVLTRYNGQGTTIDITFVSSTGASGYGSADSPFVGHYINNFTDTYVLNWVQFSTGDTQRLCGIRIAYRLLIE